MANTRNDITVTNSTEIIYDIMYKGDTIYDANESTKHTINRIRIDPPFNIRSSGIITPVAVAEATVSEGIGDDAGKLQFDWTDSDNDPDNIESYTISIESDELAETMYIYEDNDGTEGAYSLLTETVFDPGSYAVDIKAIAYGAGDDGIRKIMTASPITISAE